MRDSFDQTIIDERTAEVERLRKALADIIEANKDFRTGMPDGWEGDPLQDACDAAEGLLASVEQPRPTREAPHE